VEIFTRGRLEGGRMSIIGRLEGGRMSFIRKYGFVLALAAAVIYAYAPLTRDDIAKLRWLDDINVIITKLLAPANPGVRVVAVDPVAAANVDEDLDYRIGLRLKSSEGWRSFLSAHPDGPHAKSARAELDKLAPAEKPPTPLAAQASDVRLLETKAPIEAASAGQPSQGPKPPRLPPMKSAEPTRIVWNWCPIAAQATKPCGS
jgi:hypothetical protein